MDWLHDEEDPARTFEERREHVRALIAVYPSVFSAYAEDTALPPAPEVRAALRELGGVPASQESEDIPPAPAEAQRRRPGRPKGSRTARQPPPSETAARQLRQRQPASLQDPWHHPSRLPTTSPAASSQPPPPGSARRRKA